MGFQCTCRNTTSRVNKTSGHGGWKGGGELGETGVGGNIWGVLHCPLAGLLGLRVHACWAHCHHAVQYVQRPFLSSSSLQHFQ